MESYFFHHDPVVAPAPAEFVLFSQRRAVWQALGKRPGEMSAREWAQAVLFLGMESREAEKRNQKH